MGTGESLIRRHCYGMVCRVNVCPDMLRLIKKICSEEILFSRDDRIPCASPPPMGAGAHCDAPVLPEREISPRLCTGKTEQLQPGNAIAEGAEPPGASYCYQMISPEKNHNPHGGNAVQLHPRPLGIPILRQAHPNHLISSSLRALPPAYRSLLPYYRDQGLPGPCRQGGRAVP
jgi:hypothetical protein